MKTEKRSVRRGYFSDLPEGLRGKILEIHQLIRKEIDTLMDEEEWKSVKACDYCRGKLMDFCQSPRDNSEVGGVTCWKDSKEKFEVMIQVTGHFYNPCSDETEQNLNKFLCAVHKKVAKEISDKYQMRCEDECDEGHEGFDVYVTGEDAAEIWERLERVKTENVITFKDVPGRVVAFYGSGKRYTFDHYLEKYAPRDEDSAGVVRFTYEETETKEPDPVPPAKSALDTVAQSIMDDLSKGKKITAARMNTCATIINREFISKWSGYQSIKIHAAGNSSIPTVEFQIPKITQDFIQRFVDGRETLKGFLHRDTSIRMKISPAVFETMKSVSDLRNFLEAAVKYYDGEVEKYGVAIATEVKKLGHEMVHLVGTSKLSAIVTCPLSMLFVFDEVDMTKSDTFKVDKDDIDTVTTFIRNITKKYADPSKERKQIVKDMEQVVQALRESGMDQTTLHQFYHLPKTMEEYYNGAFAAGVDYANFHFEGIQIDTEWSMNPVTDQLKYLQEKFGVKKLKKIPRDIVAYVQIEGEAIKDANDKMMIASYCLGKIEIVEWYIELIDSGSKKYIVPHQKPYLVSIRTQLLAAYKKIMDTPIPKIAERPIIDIQYPKGYEG